MMKKYSDTTTHDSYQYLEQLQSMDKATKRELTLRFTGEQYEKLKALDWLEHKQELNIMLAIIECIVKRVKNGNNVQS